MSRSSCHRAVTTEWSGVRELGVDSSSRLEWNVSVMLLCVDVAVVVVVVWWCRESETTSSERWRGGEAAAERRRGGEEEEEAEEQTCCTGLRRMRREMRTGGDGCATWHEMR